MKRAKPVTRAKARDEDIPAFMRNKAPEKTYTYQDDVAGQPDSAFVAYDMSTSFKKGALVAHAKFGKGVVIAVAGARIDVLFEDGAKKLGHKG